MASSLHCDSWICRTPGWDREGWGRVGGTPFIGRLTELRLNSNPLTAGHLHSLAAATALEVLELYGVGLSDADATALGNFRVSGLRELELGGNQIGVGGLAELAASPRLASLTRLNLSGHPLAKGPVRRWRVASFRLVQLSLDEVELGDAGLSRLVASDRVADCATCHSRRTV